MLRSSFLLALIVFVFLWLAGCGGGGGGGSSAAPPTPPTPSIFFGTVAFAPDHSAEIGFASAATAVLTLHPSGADPSLPAGTTFQFSYAATIVAGVPCIEMARTQDIPGQPEVIDRTSLAKGTDGNVYRLKSEFTVNGSTTTNFEASPTGTAPRLFMPGHLTAGLQFTSGFGPDENMEVEAFNVTTATGEVSHTIRLHSSGGVGTGHEFSDIPASPIFYWFIPGQGFVETWQYAMVTPGAG